MKFILLASLLISSFSFSQKYKTFEGKLVYKVEVSDSLFKKPLQIYFTTVYTNDKLVRIESESNQLGSQILIKHLLLSKYYILLNINNQKFAIEQSIENDTLASKYTFSKKFGSKRFDGKKAKKIRVNAKHFSNPIDMYYFKDLNPVFLDAMKGIPGLPAEYYLQTQDGFFHYTLINYLEEKTPKELFEVSKDYKNVTFDEFMELMMQGR